MIFSSSSPKTAYLKSVTSLPLQARRFFVHFFLNNPHPASRSPPAKRFAAASQLQKKIQFLASQDSQPRAAACPDKLFTRCPPSCPDRGSSVRLPMNGEYSVAEIPQSPPIPSQFPHTFHHTSIHPSCPPIWQAPSITAIAWDKALYPTNLSLCVSSSPAVLVSSAVT